MADLYSQAIGSTTFGANAKVTKHDTFNYGTPVIYPLVVQRTDEGDWTGYASSGSDFNKVMTVIQGRAEIYGIGEIEGIYFTILVNWNSLAQDNTPSENTGSPQTDDGDLDYLQTEIFNATGVDVRIHHGKIVGDDIDYNLC